MPVPGALVKRRAAVLRRAVVAAVLAAAVTATGAGAATARVVGPDVSSHNHDNRAAVNWHVIHHTGASFAFVKATEGRTYRNPKFASDFAAVRAQRMIRGTYHFARPSGRTPAQIRGDATAEANFFVHVAGALGGPGDLPPVLDLEDAGTLNPTQLSRWTRTWLNRVKTLTRRTPIVYTSRSFWVQKMRNSTLFTANPLWLASYGFTRPVMMGGWKRHTFWQYTETGRLAGSSRRVDLSIFNGSFAQLKAMTRKKPVKLVTQVTLVAPAESGRPGTRKYATRVDALPSAMLPSAKLPSAALTAATQPAEVTRSRSTPHEWLRVFDVGRSRRFPGG